MNMSRRDMIKSAGCLAITGGFASGISAKTDGEPTRSDLYGNFGLLRPEDDPEFGPKITHGHGGGTIVGTAPSRHDEVRTGFKILLDAPRNKSVVDTAHYFEKLDIRNQEKEPYNWEWKTRANPVITGFFAATGTAPAAGDQTSWCAAFLSFCLFLANKPNKYTALSGGYRTFGTEVNDPSPGDIAVFARTGEEGTKGFGHVGLFIKSEGKNGQSGVWVLGGNQRGLTPSTGAVTEAWFPLKSKDLVLHSIRRIPGGEK